MVCFIEEEKKQQNRKIIYFPQIGKRRENYQTIKRFFWASLLSISLMWYVFFFGSAALCNLFVLL